MLVDLKREGNISYDGWSVTCSCTVGLIDELNEQAKIMEKDLQCWRLELKKARETYYQMNYYTNAQLLILREQLAQEQTLSDRLLMLLQSISPMVTEYDIKQAIRFCIPVPNATEDGDNAVQDGTMQALNIESSTRKPVAMK